MSKQAWLILLFGAAAVLAWLAAVGSLMGAAATGKAELFSVAFAFSGFLVQVLP